MLFRGLELMPTVPDSPAIVQADEEATFDPVLDELRRWEGMGVKEYSNFVSADGLLNEFAMMWSLREAFPLHFIIFKQTACHLPHEGNVEQTDLLTRWAALGVGPELGPGPPRNAGQGGLQQEGA